jgi:hypothetical protein
MSNTTANLVLTAQDKTVAAFQSAARNVRSLRRRSKHHRRDAQLENSTVVSASTIGKTMLAAFSVDKIAFAEHAYRGPRR